MEEVIKARAWTDEELLAAGYEYYERRKQLVMAARLPARAAPLYIHYPLETVVAEAGDVMIFDPGHHVKSLKGYNFWSVKPGIFLNTYKRWDEPDWSPNPPQADLMKHGCSPYYKYRGAWARRLTAPTYVQSLESPEPMLVPPGVWLAIGAMGEPWHIEDALFCARYETEEERRSRLPHLLD